MASAALPLGLALFRSWEDRASPARVTTAPPARRGPSVFIQDAVTPWNGETMLLSLLRAQALSDLEGTDPTDFPADHP